MKTNEGDVETAKRLVCISELRLSFGLRRCVGEEPRLDITSAIHSACLNVFDQPQNILWERESASQGVGTLNGRTSRN